VEQAEKPPACGAVFGRRAKRVASERQNPVGATGREAHQVLDAEPGHLLFPAVFAAVQVVLELAGLFNRQRFVSKQPIAKRLVSEFVHCESFLRHIIWFLARSNFQQASGGRGAGGFLLH
jgi:hypothetical protein